MSKIKVVPNYKKKADPNMEAYWKAFNAGKEYGANLEREKAIHYFILKLEGLKEVEGIGEVRFQKIMDYVNKEWGN